VRAEMLLFASTYVFPAIAFPLVTYAWRRGGASWPLILLIMGVPVLFGYLMPWMATSVVKRWRFTSGPRVGSYYVHHGFIYGSKLAFALLLVVRSFESIVTLFDLAAVMLVTGAATAFGGCVHDVQAVRAGKIEIDGGIGALWRFAPASYFAMGSTYAGIAVAAHRVLIHDPAAFLWALPGAFVVLCSVPSLVFIAVDPPTRRFLRDRIAGLTARATG
jgi:hypothetical protein